MGAGIVSRVVERVDAGPPRDVEITLTDFTDPNLLSFALPFLSFSSKVSSRVQPKRGPRSTRRKMRTACAAWAACAEAGPVNLNADIRVSIQIELFLACDFGPIPHFLCKRGNRAIFDIMSA